MTSSMAFFCAVDPSAFRVPEGQSAPAEGEVEFDALEELDDCGSLPQALRARTPTDATATVPTRSRLLTDTRVLPFCGIRLLELPLTVGRPGDRVVRRG
jgi:hypothetical protein